MAVQMLSANYKTDSAEPTRKENMPRLISFQFCPYVERVALIIAVKGIQCDVVNVDLKDKPQWLFKINEKGKVPAFQVNGKTLIESMLICDYIDDTFEGRKLYPSDPYEKYEHRLFLENIGPLYTAEYKFIYRNGDYSDVENALKIIEAELCKRKTTFIGGNEPMMVDYMIWPWLERLPAGLSVILKIKDWESHISSKLPLTVKYMKSMLNDSAVKKVAHGNSVYEEYYEYYRSRS